jgi:hypothetical protein
LELGTLPTVEQITLTGPSFRVVVDAVAEYLPPWLTLTVRVVEASAGPTVIPTTAAAAAAVNRTLPAHFLIVMTALLDRGFA